jgi:hypothetical protein
MVWWGRLGFLLPSNHTTFVCLSFMCFKSLMIAKEFVRAVVVRYNVDHDCLWFARSIIRVIMVKVSILLFPVYQSCDFIIDH